MELKDVYPQRGKPLANQDIVIKSVTSLVDQTFEEKCFTSLVFLF